MSEQATTTETNAAAPEGAVGASGADATNPASGASNPASAATAGATGTGTSATGAASDATPSTPKDAGKSLLEGGDSGDDGKAVTPKWPENWRDELAGGDEKLRARLDRYTTPADIAKALDAAQKKIGSGVAKAALKDDATPEELAAYRKENGIPEAADGYKVEVEGLVLGEAEKPMVDSFKEHALTKNWTPAQFNQAMEWWASEQNAAADRQYEADSTFKQTAEDTLRKEWGPEYRANLNAISNVMATLPGDLGERLVNGRTADGRRIGDDPAFAGWLANMAREMNPAASVLPAGVPSTGASVESRISEIKTIMREDNRRYVNSPELQQEYMSLVSAREKMQKRGA